MSWLYTLVFTGLLFSSNSGSNARPDNGGQLAAMPAVNVRTDETEKFEQSYPLSASGKVSVSNVNGSITVESWDRNEVKLEYTKTADSKERLADVEVRIDARADSFSVDTDYGDWKRDKNGDKWKMNGKLTVEFHLTVPRGAVLNEIETVNGSITVSNFVNFTKASAVNGSVNASNLRGTARLSTVNGEVAADFDRLETGSKISLETVNGKVNLVIPSDSSATVKADSLNGNITNDFGLPVRKGKYVGRDMYGRLGAGDVQIKLSSVNGALSIAHKADGRTTSPATNLLPQKKDGDDDWDKDDDNDDDSMASPKVNKEIARAAKDAQKHAARIDPEIGRVTAESVARAAEAIQTTAEIFQSDSFKQKIKDIEKKQGQIVANVMDAVFMPSVSRVEMRSGSFIVKGTPKVIIDAKGCSVSVRGWDKSEVQYRVTQLSDARSASPLKMGETHSDPGVTISVADPDAAGAAVGGDARRVRVEVFVPKKTDLKITASGEIRLDGVSGELELSGGDESINVRDADGSLHVASSTGGIRVIGFQGDVNAESSNGTISLEGDFQKLRAHATDGGIVLTLPEDVQADLEMTCPDVQGDGIALTRISSNDKITKYRIGRGGRTFRLETDGEISVRGAGSIRTSY